MVFLFIERLRNSDDKMKVCFLKAGEMYYGSYSDIFSSLPANCFIRKPITNRKTIQAYRPNNVWQARIIIISMPRGRMNKEGDVFF